MAKANDYQAFKKLPLEQKLPTFERNGVLFDLIYTQQLDRMYCRELFAIADNIRYMAKTKEGSDYLQTILSDKRAMLFFAQPSTRTFLSFQNACHLLGMRTSEIRDTATSSEIKGESHEDSIRTFAGYVDLIIVRHKEAGFAEKAAWTLSQFDEAVPVINGGAGKDEHPTQALLDLYTIKRSFKDRGGIDGKKVAMIGDLDRGRTTRSLTQLLANYEEVEFYFVAPKEFQMRKDVLDFLDEKGLKYHIVDSLGAVLSEADIFYFTRLQDEHDTNGESKNIDYSKFHINDSHLAKMKEHSIIMHPFPRRGEIDTSVDKDPRAIYWHQSINGMWIRAALIAKLLSRETMILEPLESVL